MMEYRVIYYTESFGDGIGSPSEPWIGYEGDDYEEARQTFYHLDANFDEVQVWQVRLQSRDVTEWTTLLGMKRDGAVR